VLDLDSGTLTPMLKRMEAANLIERKRSSEDERVVVIRITEAGRALEEKAVCIPQSLFASSSLPLEQLIAMNDQLKLLMRKINQVTQSDGVRSSKS
jgi:DNA-binding MarR family transcriptional regulator